MLKLLIEIKRGLRNWQTHKKANCTFQNRRRSDKISAFPIHTTENRVICVSAANEGIPFLMIDLCYAVTTHKDSGIKNDPNDWAAEVGNPRYILDLLLSVIRLSVETVEIVSKLPGAGFGEKEGVVSPF